MKKEEITKTVRKRYANIAKQSAPCCNTGAAVADKTSACCGTTDVATVQDISKTIGYSDTDMNSVPEGANLGLGCGNPVALASLKEGEVVLDLGSGAGFDCFLAAARVGRQGKVIGVDMTPEMLDKARENVRKGNYENIEFRLGEIENVFKEAFRVLKPGGRLMVSDIVLLGDLPQDILNSVEAYVGCIAGASKKSDYLEAIKAAGFTQVEVVDETVFPTDDMANDPTVKAVIEEAHITPAQVKTVASSIMSIKVSALKE
jgi:SAM-dependent methyltransferase